MSQDFDLSTLGGVYQELESFDDLIQLSHEPIFLNDLDITKLEDKEILNKFIMTTYDDDVLSSIPSCECGVTMDAAVSRCPHCNTAVTLSIERPIEPRVWFRVPDGVSALMSPVVWMILSSSFTINKCNLIEWLCNPSYKGDFKENRALRELQSYRPARGLNAFVEHFDEIIEILLRPGIYNKDERSRQILLQFLSENRDKIFCHFIPIPNKIALVAEKTPTATYVDKNIASMQDAVLTATSLYSEGFEPSQRVKELRCVKFITQLGEYYKQQFLDSLGQKEGWLRKHVFGTRSWWTARCVISSLTENHEYDELHIPWGVATGIFRLHIVNRLRARGWSPDECNAFVYQHTLHYHPLLDEIFQEIIADSPHKGIPCLFTRYPSLTRGSTQQFFITKVKPDPEIVTISLSVLSIVASNADFDGDCMALTLILDQKMYERLSRLHPSTGVLSLKKPRTVSPNIKIPKPALETIAAWMYEKKEV